MLREGVVINLIVLRLCQPRWGEVMGEKLFSKNFLNARISAGIFFTGPCLPQGDGIVGVLRSVGKALAASRCSLPWSCVRQWKISAECSGSRDYQVRCTSHPDASERRNFSSLQAAFTRPAGLDLVMVAVELFGKNCGKRIQT